MARPKGSLNTKTVIAKEAFQKAFDLIGGVEKLSEWAKDHPGEFYKIYGRLIPADVNAKLSGEVKVNGTVNFVKPPSRD